MSDSATTPAGTSAAPASFIQRLRAGEARPRLRPASLQTLPAAILERLDHDPAVAASDARAKHQRSPIGGLVVALDALTGVRAPFSSAEIARAREIVSALDRRIYNSKQQLSAFLACRGEVTLTRLLHAQQHERRGASEAKLQLQPLILDIVELLAELAIGDRAVAESLATRRSLVALLFELMAEKKLVDVALTLAQELLSVGRHVFPLQELPELPRLLSSLSPRGLSLVGRAIAVLLAKAAEEVDEVPGAPPPPECVPPDLCASCRNNRLLLELPELLPRVVALLRLAAPPAGLSGHMLAQLGPSAQGLVDAIPAHDEQGWDSLDIEPPATPHIVVLLAPEQVPPALRDLVTHSQAPLFPGAAAPNQPPTPHGSLHLSTLQAALWATLQGDLLYLLWALLGSKTKADAQRRLVELGFVEVLHAMLHRLSWRQPTVQSTGGAEPSETQPGTPEAQLQLQLLRTIQTLCEKEPGQPTYHQLLLEPPPPPQPLRKPPPIVGPQPAPPASPTEAEVADAIADAQRAAHTAAAIAADAAAPPELISRLIAVSAQASAHAITTAAAAARSLLRLGRFHRLRHAPFVLAAVFLDKLGAGVRFPVGDVHPTFL